MLLVLFAGIACTGVVQSGQRENQQVSYDTQQASGMLKFPPHSHDMKNFAEIRVKKKESQTFCQLKTLFIRRIGTESMQWSSLSVLLIFTSWLLVILYPDAFVEISSSLGALAHNFMIS